MILAKDKTFSISLDKSKLRNHFSVSDSISHEIFARNNSFMKISNKTKNKEKFDFLDIKSSELSNRAYAQITRRLREYRHRKIGYRLKSDYVKYLSRKLISSDLKGTSLKRCALPLIASFIVTDGHTTLRKKKELEALEMGFANKNIELVNAFNDLIFLTYKEIPSSMNISPHINKTLFIGSWHKPMIKEIINCCYKHNKKSIKNLLNYNKKILAECFRIAMSCDGFVSLYISKDNYGYKGKKYYNRIRGSLQLGCKPLEVRKDWIKLTSKLGLNFKLQKDRIRSTDYKSLEKFLKFGGFIPNTYIGKSSKYFGNLDKNKALKTLILIRNRKLNNLISDKKEERLLIIRVNQNLK